MQNFFVAIVGFLCIAILAFVLKMLIIEYRVFAPQSDCAPAGGIQNGN